MDSSIKALHRNVAEWLAGPTGSVFLHVALLLAVLLFVDFSSQPDEAAVEITYLEIPETTIDPIPPALEPPPDMVEFEPTVESPPMDFETIDPPEIVQFDQPTPTESSLDRLEIPTVPSVLVIQNLAAGALRERIGAGSHEVAGRKYGGAHWREAEIAVNRALEWLRVNQNADGSWGRNDKEAMGGLGILTFLAHGETTASATYGETVRRALTYLLERQNEAGEFARTDTTGGTYAQAICVYAVSEAYGMTRIPHLREPMERGAEILIRGQQAKGGFDYRFAKGERRDTSLGGWCAQAMKAAFIAGAGNPGLKVAMDMAVADMKSAQRDDGSLCYTDLGSHSTHGITAVGVLSMQLLGHSRSAEVRRGLSYLDSARCDWRNPPAWPMYAWYYLSQAKFHEGGGSWRNWNNQFAPQLIRNQNPDGSWSSAGLAMKSGITGREDYHPAYSTTLAALTLQVYYRFLPTYQPMEEKAVDQTSADDVKIQVL